MYIIRKVKEKIKVLVALSSLTGLLALWVILYSWKHSFTVSSQVFTPLTITESEAANMSPKELVRAEDLTEKDNYL